MKLGLGGASYTLLPPSGLPPKGTEIGGGIFPKTPGASLVMGSAPSGLVSALSQTILYGRVGRSTMTFDQGVAPEAQIKHCSVAWKPESPFPPSASRLVTRHLWTRSTAGKSGVGLSRLLTRTL